MDNQFPEQPERDFWAEWREMNERHYQEYQQWLSQFQQWQAEQQRQAGDRQRQELERQQTEENRRREDQQRQADERRAQDDRQRETDRTREEQRQRDDQRRQEEDRRKQRETEQVEKSRPITSREQAMYEQYNRYLREESASIADRKYGLDRHDFYNIDTAHELDSAMLRAELQGVNVRDERQFQKFLDREAKEGINQRAGKRPLADRYRELCEKRDAAIHQLKRGVPSEMVAPIKLYESGWEQQHRMEQEQQRFRENADWQRHLEAQQVEHDRQDCEDKSFFHSR